MSHQLPIGISVCTGRDTVLERPELAVRIAQTATLWNLVERHLMYSYSAIMGRKYISPTLYHGIPFPSHPVGLQVFDTLDSFHTKLRLFEALFKWFVQDRPDLLVQWEDVRKQMGKAYKARNRIVHGVWGISADYPDALILQPMYREIGFTVWYEPDFEAEIKKVIDAHKMLGWLMAVVQKTYDTQERQSKQ